MRSASLTLEEKRSSARVMFGFLIPFVLAFCFGAFLDVGLYVDSFKFSKTIGIVAQKELIDSGSRGKVRLNCAFFYEFDIDGHKYGGGHITPESAKIAPFILIPFHTTTEHDCPYFDSIPARGESVQVLYNPKNPAKSILIRRLPIIIFSVAFILVAIWIFLGIYIIALRRRAANLL